MHKMGAQPNKHVNRSMVNYSDNRYFELFKAQKANQFKVANTSYSERIGKLNALQRAIEVTYKSALRAALYKDFKKPVLEADMSEIYLVVKEIKHAKAKLHKWMKQKKVGTPLALLGTSSKIVYEPKGVCLIISPWNYPVTLTFSPLVSAIAAGNTAIIKPSELTPNTSAVMAEIVTALFEKEEVALVEGEVDVAKALLELPFNHIHFTGSPTVGKLIMKAAAAHLTSVTLELGGKSPTLIDKSINLEAAVASVVWIKHYNNGQTCIAPDYVLIHESLKDRFVSLYKEKLVSFYGKHPNQSNAYSRVVNERHFERLKSAIEDAKTLGAAIESGGTYDNSDFYISPTLMSNVPENAVLMQEEIFGPVLPIRTYSTLTEAIDYINTKEKPLALYIYSKRKKTINHIIKSTRAGTTGINNAGLQFVNPYLPFGGSNNSGIGKAHGYEGFKSFSNARAVLKQVHWGPIAWFKPPYTKFTQKLADLTIKWF